MKKRINIMLEEEAYERIKSYAKTDHRSAAKEMSLILELYRPGLIPGISVMPSIIKLNSKGGEE